MTLRQARALRGEYERVVARVSGVCRRPLPIGAKLAGAVSLAETWQRDAAACIATPCAVPAGGNHITSTSTSGGAARSLAQLDVDVSNLQQRADALSVDVSSTRAYKKLRWKLRAERWRRSTRAALGGGRAGATPLRTLATLLKEASALELDDSNDSEGAFPCLDKLRSAAIAAAQWKASCARVCPPAHATRRGATTRELRSAHATLAELEGLLRDAEQLSCVVPDEESRLARLCGEARAWSAKAATTLDACAARYGAKTPAGAEGGEGRTKGDLAAVAQLRQQAEVIPIRMPLVEALETVAVWLHWTVEVGRVLPPQSSANSPSASAALAQTRSARRTSIREIQEVMHQIPMTPEGWAVTGDSELI